MDGGDSSGTNKDEYVTTVVSSGTGRLTVDSSRYSNLSQIPMLTCGIVCTSDESSDSGATYFASNNSNNQPNGGNDFRDSLPEAAPGGDRASGAVKRPALICCETA